MGFQDIFAAFMGSSHFKNTRDCPYFLPSFSGGPGNWSLLNPALTSGNCSCQGVRMKCLSRKDESSSAPQLLQLSVCIVSVLFIQFLKGKTKAKSKHPNKKKRQNTKTTTQPPATSSHSNRALSLQVTEIQIC